jgi:uncharacterized membrane protein HdeD (DUF308 family)
MAQTKKKYIESHWLVFILKGAAAVLLGAFTMFAMIGHRELLIMVALALLILGAVEVFNVFHRRKNQHDFGFALAIALVEIGTAIALFFTQGHENIVSSTVVLAIYTLLRGAAEILTGINSLTDKTDKFMWIAAGIVGAVVGFLIFTFPAEDNTTFIRIFGGYMMIFGLTDVMFGVHARSALMAKKK